MTDYAPYKIGTITVTNGSAAVVGTGTLFGIPPAPGAVQDGDQLIVLGAGTDKFPYSITVVDDTHLTLDRNYGGTTGSGVAYVIYRTSGARNSTRGVSQQLSEFLDALNLVDGDVVGPSSAVDGHIALFDGATGKLLKDGGAAVSDMASVSTTREKLTAARTYYVRADGSDSNNGLANTSGGAFLTIQKAVDVVAGLDLSIYQATIQVGSGTYTAPVTLKLTVGALPPILKGDVSTPGNVVISTTGASALSIGAFANWVVQGFKLQAATSGLGISASGSCTLLINAAMEYGACATSHIGAGRGAYVNITASYAISGSAPNHYSVGATGKIVVEGGTTVTLSGTPAFSTTFANVAGLSFLRATGTTFTGGTPTGVRYIVSNNSVIETGGGGSSFFPGNSAGSSSAGGQYV